MHRVTVRANAFTPPPRFEGLDGGSRDINTQTKNGGNMNIVKRNVMTPDGPLEIPVRLISLPFGNRGMVHRPLGDDSNTSWVVSEYFSGRQLCDIWGPMKCAIAHTRIHFNRVGANFIFQGIEKSVQETGFANEK